MLSVQIPRSSDQVISHSLLGTGTARSIVPILNTSSEIRQCQSQRRIFIEAARDGKGEVVQTLLRNRDKNSPSIREQDITRALQEASGGGHEEVVGMLLVAGANINVDPIPCQDEMNIIRDYDDWTAERAEKIVCGSRVCGDTVCGPEACGQTALQAAARAGHLGIVATLLKSGAHIDASASRYNGKTALQAAAANGHAPVVSLLLSKGADVNAEPSHYHGRTALQAAAEGGHTKIVSMLLEAGAEINAEPASHHRRTALQAAAEGGYEDIVTILLDKKADINAKPSSNLNHGRTALQAAAAGGYGRIVLTLLEAFAEINAPPSKCHGRTALQAAAENGHTDVVFILLNAGADYNAEPSSKFGRTALQAAAGAGHTAIVRILRNVGADINADPSPNHGRTALQAAAEGGHTEIVLLLLEAGANVNADPSRKYGKTALQAAAAKGHLEIVRVLCYAGADINAAPSSSHGRTALQAAAEGGNVEIVALLLRLGAKITAVPSNRGRTALQAAAAGGHIEIIVALLAAGADVNEKPSANFNHGVTALQGAAKGGHVEIVNILLQAGAEINASPSRCHGRTALQAAAAGGYKKTIQVLLRAGANTNAEPATYSGRTALQAAAGGGYADVVSDLLSAGAEVDAEPSQSDGRTALQAAAEGGHFDIVFTLLEAGANVNAEPSSNHGRTALQAAAEGNHSEIVSVLLNAKAEINAEPSSSHGRTVLQAAAEGGHIDMVLTLLAAGADINAPPSGFHGRTALQTAAGGGYVGIVLTLLSRPGAEINAQPSMRGGRTALQAAAEGGHVTIVSTLLNKGADINAPPAKYSGRTALEAAAGGGHQRMTKLLLEYVGPSQSPSRPLLVKQRRMLLPRAHVNARPGHGQEAMKAAAEGGYGDVVELLLNAGVEVNATDTEGTTCLKWANNHPQIVQLLLKRGADHHAQDTTGATPLHWAARGDNAKSLSLLIEAGADTEALDYQDRRPLDILLEQLEVPSMQLIRPLLKNGSSIRGRTMDDWRKALNAKEDEVVVVTQTVNQGKTSLDIRQLKQDKSELLEEKSDCSTRALYSAIKFPTHSDFTEFFPYCSPLEKDNMAEHGIVQWFWTLEQKSSFFGMPPRPDIHGTGLPNHIGKLATTVDTQALLTCYVRFEYLVQNETETADDSSQHTAGKPFKTKYKKTEISWTMRRPFSNPSTRHDSENTANGKINTIFHSTDYRSTLDTIGWIPDHGIDFFSMFIADLQKKWDVLLEKADKHLTTNRMSILENRGTTANFIDNLLQDEKQWMKFQELLQIHLQKARCLLQNFKDHRYLHEETIDRVCDKENKTKSASHESTAIDGLSKIIQDFESKVDEAIKNLDLKKHEMIQLECNLASIHEARTAKTTGISMKRLSWITFVFLPMMFVASLFGMNVDIINGGPRWTWALVFGVAVSSFVILIWMMLRENSIHQWLKSHISISLIMQSIQKAIQENIAISQWKISRRRGFGTTAIDLESQKILLNDEFDPTQSLKRWKKVKDH